jgi:hypothetical protein
VPLSVVFSVTSIALFKVTDFQNIAAVSEPVLFPVSYLSMCSPDRKICPVIKNNNWHGQVLFKPCPKRRNPIQNDSVVFNPKLHFCGISRIIEGSDVKGVNY